MRFFSVGFPLAFAFGWFLLLEDFLGHVGAGVATCWDIVGAPLGDQVDLVLGRDLDGDGDKSGQRSRPADNGVENVKMLRNCRRVRRFQCMVKTNIS